MSVTRRTSFPFQILAKSLKRIAMDAYVHLASLFCYESCVVLKLKFAMIETIPNETIIDEKCKITKKLLYENHLDNVGVVFK